VHAADGESVLEALMTFREWVGLVEWERLVWVLIVALCWFAMFSQQREIECLRHHTAAECKAGGYAP
jgi:hypothetical protein